MADVKKTSIAGNTCHLLHQKQPEKTVKRLKLGFQRIKAKVNIMKSGKQLDISLGLLDISESGVGFFSEQLLSKGSTIELCISEPRILRLIGLVAWSVPIKSGVHQAKYSYRSGMQFQFENEVQRAALIEFIQKIAVDPSENFKQQNAQKATVPTDPATAVPPIADAPAPAAAPVVAPVAEAAPVLSEVPAPVDAPAASAPENKDSGSSGQGQAA